MSPSPGRHRRIVGGGLVIANLLSVAVGYGLTTKLPALEASAPMQFVGAVTLCMTTVLSGRSPFRRYNSAMWALMGRLAAGNAIVVYTYPYAVQRLTLGTVAAVAVVGYLSVELTRIWRYRATAWGLKHLCGRALVLGGVVMLNRPWQGDFDARGISCAVVSAVCAWNTITVLGRMKKHGLVDQGATIANLLSVPVLFGLVFALRGGGWMSWHLFSTAGLAGLLTLFLPVLLVNAALRRSPASDVAVAQSLSSPINALVAEIGTLLGLLSGTQRVTLDGWAAIALIAGATFGVSLIRDPVGGMVLDRKQGSDAGRRR